MPNILIVKDIPAKAKWLVELVEHHGHTAQAATTGKDELQRLRRRPFAMLLLDVVVPRMTGSNLADRLPGLYLIIKVLMVSGKPDSFTE